MDEDLSLSAFFEAWELFQYPILAGTFAGAVLGCLGVYVVLRRQVFLSAAVSQVAGLGIVFGFFMENYLWHDFPPGLSAVLFTGGLALYWRRSARPGISADTWLGWAYLLGGAGTLALGSRVVQELHDVDSILLGSAVAVLPGEFYLLATVLFLIAVLQVWWWRGFVLVSFDYEGAKVRGLPTKLLDLSLFACLALAVALSTRTLGALPSFAFCVLPAAAALRLMPNLATSLLFASALGAGLGFGGYLLAYLWQLPVGATQSLLGVAAMLVAATIARLIGKR